MYVQMILLSLVSLHKNETIQYLVVYGIYLFLAYFF